MRLQKSWISGPEQGDQAEQHDSADQPVGEEHAETALRPPELREESLTLKT
jgi:hypothetical protein